MDSLLPVIVLIVGGAIGGYVGFVMGRNSAKGGADAMRADLSARLEEQRIAHESRVTELQESEKKLADTFEALSSKALRHNNESFLSLAKQALETQHEAAKGDLEKRQQAIGELVDPVRKSLDKVEGRIGEIEKLREGAYAELREQLTTQARTVSELNTRTTELVGALKSPIARGRWGEIALKRVVEMAGMLNHCDFSEQESSDTDEGRKRPDMVVHLPAGRRIVVDSKVPLSSYMEAQEVEDTDQRAALMVEHAKAVRSRAQELGQKKYWEQFDDSPEFVVMFLPGENFFSAALESDPSLIEESFNNKVIIATPTTLISLLRAVYYGWRQESLAENAREVSDLGKELHKRVGVMADHFANVGKNLDSAVGAYNKTVSSLESRVLSTSRKFEELNVADSDKKNEPKSIETAAKKLTAPELTKDDSEDY